MITETLFGFACLIANGDASKDPTVLEARKIVSNMSVEQQREISETIAAGVCLPDAFEKLIAKTRTLVEDGTIQELQAAAGPSVHCY